MKQQMAFQTKIALGFIGLIGVVLMVCFANYISAYNYGNKMENLLKATKENNKNVYAEGTLKVQEVAEIPAMYRDDYVKVIRTDIEGRYGSGGSKATLQFLKEHNVTLDVQVYTKIQQQIEIFRNKFEINQTQLIDVRRSYQTALGSFWEGTWLEVAGYPKVKLEDFGIITTDQTEKVFTDGKETGPMKLRDN